MSSQRMRKRLLILLLIFVIGVLYLFWRMTTHDWTGLLLWGYLLVATAWMGYALMGVSQLWWPSQSDPVFLFQRAAAESRIGWFARLRALTAIVLQNAVNALSWPATLVWVYGRLKRVNRARSVSAIVAFGADEILHPPSVVNAIGMTMIATTAFFATRWIAPLQQAGMMFMGVVGGYAILSLLLYVVSPVSLPLQLRRGPKSPYLHFVVVAACFSVMLLLSFSAFRHGPASVDRSRLLQTALDLLTFRQVWLSKRLTPPEYMLAAASLLYYSVLLRTIIRWKEFQRTDDDLRVIASAFLNLGKFSSALAWLDQVNAKEAQTLLGYTVAYLGVNQIDKAYEAAKTARELMPKQERMTLDANHSLVDLSLSYPVPRAVVVEGFRRWMVADAPDALVATTLPLAVRAERIRQADADALLVAVNAENRYPLASVVQLIRSEKFRQAREILERLHAGTVLDEVAQKLFLLIAAVSSKETTLEQDRLYFDSWASANLPQFTGLVDSLTENYERVLFLMLVSELPGIAADLGEDRMEECQHLVDQAMKSITSGQIQNLSKHLLQYVSSD